MNFEKKLIILSGNNCKGTINFERSAYGTYAAVNLFGAPDLKYGEYGLGIRAKTRTIVLNVGGLGRIMARHKIDDVPLTELHCFLFNKQNQKIVMYGTNSSSKLWEANLMDGIKGEKDETQKSIYETNQTKNPPLPNYSDRPKEVGEYFFDILPKDSKKYMDEAIAEVNYYSGEMNQEIDADFIHKQPLDNLFSVFGQDAQSKESYFKTDKKEMSFYPHEKQEARAEVASAESRAMPSLLERQYLYRYRKEVLKAQTLFAQSSSQEQANIYAQPQEQPNAYAQPQEQPNTYAQRQEQANIYAQPQEQPNTYAQRQEPYGDVFKKERVPSPSAMPNVKGQASKESNMFNPLDTLFEPMGKTVKSLKKEEPTQHEGVTIQPPSDFTVEEAVKGRRKTVGFYEQTKMQIDALFQSGERFNVLEEMIPQSKWIKINYDQNGKYYVVGIIGSKPDYLCYGVPASFTPQAPPELDGYCTFLPLDPTRPQEKGFWLMFQDAETGESVGSPV